MSTSAGPFAYIDEPEHLAAALGVLPLELEEVARLIAQGVAYQYRTKLIHGKSRQLAIPLERPKALQRRIADLLWPLTLELHPATHGYVPERSTTSNATPHCGATWIQKLDIKDFYPSTISDTITSELVDRGVTLSVAKVISSLVTDRDRLPLGAPCSPLISNLVLAPVDFAVARQADERMITYTRYADDLTFSSRHRFDMTNAVTAALEPLGYMLNPEKSRLRRRGQSIAVTGLRVNEPGSPTLPKRYKRRLRQEFHYIEKLGLEEHCFSRYTWHWIDEGDTERQLEHSRKHLQGKVKYALGIEKEWMTRLLEAYPAAAAELRPSPAKRSERRLTYLLALPIEIRNRQCVALARQARILGEPEASRSDARVAAPS